MTTILFVLSLAQISTCLIAQDENTASSGGEELVRTDTMRISPGIETMVFKYYRFDGGYSFQGGKGSGRFEVYLSGTSRPFQQDTLDDIMEVSYEDANFDGIADIRILTLRGMSGDNNSNEFYFYNPKTRLFEYGIGGLSNPSINTQDSTISSSGYCCMGTSGSGETYKYVDGRFKLIKESAYSREYSYGRELIGDRLVTTDTTWSTTVEDDDGEQFMVDSTWKYLFGKLRIVGVDRKVACEESQKDSSREEGLFSEDVMGAFIFKSEEAFEYSKTSDGTLMCSYTLRTAKNKELMLVKESKWPVKDE